MQSIAYFTQVAQIDQAGPHWQRMLREGHGKWPGDPWLTLGRNKLTDMMEVWYERLNEKPRLVASIPIPEFDIYRVLDILYDASHTTSPVVEKLKEIDRFNEAVAKEKSRMAQEKMGEAHERMHWAIRKDTGHHIAPMTVPEVPSDSAN